MKLCVFIHWTNGKESWTLHTHEIRTGGRSFHRRLL